MFGTRSALGLNLRDVISLLGPCKPKYSMVGARIDPPVEVVWWITIILSSTCERGSTALDGRLVIEANMDVIVTSVRGSVFSTLKRFTTLE